MSGSEDGQLRSPGEELLSDDEHDTDSLDIKPPQASVNYGRDSSGSSRRKDDRKSVKDKRHSKERRHREHSGREHERDIRNSGGGGGVGGSGINISDRRGELERRENRREDIDPRYHQRNSYDDNRDVLVSKSERRYQKHYDRGNEAVVSRGGSGVTATSGNHGYHYQQQQQQQQQSYHHQAQMHMQRQRQDYYDQRNQSYHSGSGGGGAGGAGTIDYYNNRHQPYGKHSIHDENYEMQQRERRKYHYEHTKDAESLEQDLRSRLISKRHKYVKSNDDDDDEQYDMRVDRHDYEHVVNERGYEERERSKLTLTKAERHRQHHEKAQHRENVIEVLDSPELAVMTESQQKRSKHKRHHKEKSMDMREKRRTTPDDPELLARREKFLAAEREKEKRMEELEARRELRRERKEVMDTLSPSAVAASVTAGLNVMVTKRKKSDEHSHAKRKRTKRERDAVSDDDDEDGDRDDANNDDDIDNSATEDDDEEMDEDDEDDGSDDSSSDSANAASEKSFRKTNKTSRKHDKTAKPLDSNDEIELPESPLSIGELSKSPPKHDITKKRSTKHRNETETRTSRSPHSGVSERSNSRSISPSHSRSNSRISHSQSRSRSVTRSRSASPEDHRSRSRSRSTHSASSRSRSRSVHSDSVHSRSSRSPHSRSRSHSEEHDMEISKEQEEDDTTTAQAAKPDALDDTKKKSTASGIESPICDDKGVPLPNYFPGVQGCRSVEEFQYLNRIAEGTYGVVYRAKDKRTNEIVALKRLKMEKEKEGFPITSLREINTLLKGQHPNIVTVREIVCSNMDMIYIVMDYVEHDLKSLMETMKSRKQSFFPAEVKCLTQQLLRAVGHLHDNWILHRDLKTSNLLLSHKGVLKVGDFGLAREYGSPLKQYTSLVVTLWYRAPELLLCSPEYSTPIDIWSVGCIFAEFLLMAPLFPGRSEIDELNRIFKELGTPNEKIWPGYDELPAVKNLLRQNSQFPEFPATNMRKRFSDKTSDAGISLLQGLLTYDPKQRLNADAALKHQYFKELPPPIDPSMFPTWPAKSEMGARKAHASPKPPSGGSQFKQLGRDDVLPNASGGGGGGGSGKIVTGIITGNKKTATNTGFVLNAGIDQRQLAMGPGFSLRF